MSKSINEKNIWLTGASRGIGLAIANVLADKCSKLILSAKNPNSFINLPADLKNKNIVFLFPSDFSNSSKIQDTYSKIEIIAGGIDILINNAGIFKAGSVLDITPEDFDKMFQINTKAPLLAIQSVLPGMLERKSGIIINILSVAAISFYSGCALYNASKSALLAISRSIRPELRSQGIKIIDILPGATNTEIWSEEERRQFGPKMMKAEDIASIVEHILQMSEIDRAMIEEIVVRPQMGDL